MLAQPTRGISEVLDRMEESGGFTCEYKYDGERAQIHMVEGGKIRVFSRNLEDNTGKYPDLVRDVPLAIVDSANTTSFILDCEAVAWDKEKQKRRPFQVRMCACVCASVRLLAPVIMKVTWFRLKYQILSTRRKKNVDAGDVEVAVMTYAFDLLYLNGQSLLKSTLVERRKLLHATFAPVRDKFAFAQAMDCSKAEEVQELLEASVREDCEGLMVKTLLTNAT